MNSGTADSDEQPQGGAGRKRRAGLRLDWPAAEAGSDLVLLPEFFHNEYFPQFRDARYMEYTGAEDGYTASSIREVARRHGLYVVSTIFEMARPGLYCDSAMGIGPR